MLMNMSSVAYPSLLTYDNFIHAISGGLGSIFAITLFYPLETVRTRLQVDDKREARYSPYVIADILKEEGLRYYNHGIYRGWQSLVISLFFTNFVYFYIFHGLKSVKDGVSQNILLDLLFGIIAGCTAVIIVNPLWVVSTRLKLQDAKLRSDQYKQLKHPRYKGVVDCFWKICSYEGLAALWGGLVPSLLLTSNPAIQFMVYELLKRNCQWYFTSQDLCGVIYFFSGGIAKIVATVITYPLQSIQTRVRAGCNKVNRTPLTTRRWVHLFRGMESKLTQTVLTAALMLLTYEKIATFVFNMVGIDRRYEPS